MPKFHVEIIKPSHYDKDGYVIQWWKAWIPSNSMACLHAIATDCAERRVLGENIWIEVNAYDEMNIKIPVDGSRANQTAGHTGLVCLVGVQSNQFPRAMAIARRFRSRGVAVAIGGFHVSGCLAMLKGLTPELQDAVDLGVILYAGEAEEHFEAFLRNVHRGDARPVYNTWTICPACKAGPSVPAAQARPALRWRPVVIRRRAGLSVSMFILHHHQCAGPQVALSRRRRYRAHHRAERRRRRHAIFITDDNFARNRNWEAIFDRMIE